MSESRYLSVKAACRYMGIPEDTLRCWVRLKQIQYSKVNGRVLFDREVLDQRLADCAVPEEAKTTG